MSNSLKKADRIKGIEAVIGYNFKDKRLISAAMIHPSRVGKRAVYQFERLEFLGDRVLGLIVAEMIYQQFPTYDEGALSQKLASLVSRETCRKVALAINLDRLIDIRESDFRSINTSFIANALEAILGAIYLDNLSVEPCRIFIAREWQKFIERTDYRDPKTVLQEWSQRKNLGVPHYVLIEREGPDHSPLFTILLTIDNKTTLGKGYSKKQAERAAAEEYVNLYLNN